MWIKVLIICAFVGKILILANNLVFSNDEG